MKWLLAPLVWLVAVGLAAFIAWRLWRGQPVVLTGTSRLTRLAGPRVVRALAIVLVGLGVGEDRAEAHGPVPAGPGAPPRAAEPSADPPAPFTEATVNGWVALNHSSGAWLSFKQQFTSLQAGGHPAPEREQEARFRLRVAPPRLRALLGADLDALLAGKAPAPITPRDLLAALDEAEKAPTPFYDPWVTAYLWRKSAAPGGEPADRVELHARLARHARLSNALIKARAEAGAAVDLEPRAWMSKAGPRPGEIAARQASLRTITDAANRGVGLADQGTWLKDGMAALAATAGPALTLHHDGSRRPVPTDRPFRWHRLDLVQVPAGAEAATLTHATYGRVVLPGGTLASVQDLPRYLSEDGKRAVERDVLDAMKGSETAAARLEKALPLAHARLRQELLAQPRQAGAARLRLILSLFDG